MIEQFRGETGMTPAAYVEMARVESARMALEAGTQPVETIARQVGFGTVETMRRAFRRRVQRCLALQPANPHGRRLQKRDAKIQDSLFVFLEDAAIPPTNNSSEQAIRMSTVFRKVTNGFRSDWGRDLFAAVRSVVNTGKRQGLSAYQAIQKALAPIGSLFEPG